MKRFLKAFTLIELIIAMAIFSILMAGVIKMYQPIRQTYLESTLQEKQRTAQNGIIEYLCENVRYAEKMSFYDKGCNNVPSLDPLSLSSNSVNSANDAVKAFIDEYYGNRKTEGGGAFITDLKKRIRVIVINREDVFDSVGTVQSVSNVDDDHAYYGRLITNVSGEDASTAFTKDCGERTTHNTTGNSYMALGGGYYGNSDYQIYLNYDLSFPSDAYSGMVYFTVRNSFKNSGNIVENGNGLDTTVANDGSVTLETTNSARTINLDKDVRYYKASGSVLAHGNPSPTGSASRKNTYIVYVIPEEGQR